MKKLFALIPLLFTTFLSAQTYHIHKTTYTIDGKGSFGFGKTSEYALSQEVPVNTLAYFETEEAFNEYLTQYKQSLLNTRAFDVIEIDWTIVETTNETNEIELQVYVKDTSHLLALPHVIGYNSNEGWNPKLKAKDSNFLGSLNTMSTDVYALLPIASDNKNYEFGANFSFNLPFKFSIFDSQWINDYTLSYSLENPSPEWSAKTGLLLSIPKDFYKYQFEFYQYSYRDFSYQSYNDSTYFKEEADFSIPIYIYSIPFFEKITYTPKVLFTANWDKDSINTANNDLYSPCVSLLNSITTNTTNWNGNYRKGYYLKASESLDYYIQRNDIIPYLSFEADYYNYISVNESNWFNKIGLASRLISFNYFNTNHSDYYYGSKIGSKLRGIRDNQSVLNTSGALILNLDFPFHIWTTDFNSKFLKIFNCEVQFSPFLDIAICNNYLTETKYSIKDGFYAGGIEVLVYPRKWSSFTVRGSIGYDLSRSLLKKYVNTDWRQNIKKYEISIGLGLQY